jgi:hypothetical protein
MHMSITDFHVTIPLFRGMLFLAKGILMFAMGKPKCEYKAEYGSRMG